MLIKYAAPLLLALLALLGVSAASAADSVILTGEVTYRERIALPPDARLRMTLVRLPGETVVVRATGQPAEGGQVPLKFTLDLRSKTLSPDGRYGLIAEILSDGQVMFRNGAPALVDIASGLPTRILVRRFISPAPQPEPALPPNPLLDTSWTVSALGGAPTLAGSVLTLAFTPDNAVNGSGGCNRYFAEARFMESPLSFGPVAGTMMACSEALMSQESAFFAALEATAGYKLDGDRLQLRDRAGKTLLDLRRAP